MYDGFSIKRDKNAERERERNEIKNHQTQNDCVRFSRASVLNNFYAFGCVFFFSRQFCLHIVRVIVCTVMFVREHKIQTEQQQKPRTMCGDCNFKCIGIPVLDLPFFLQIKCAMTSNFNKVGKKKNRWKRTKNSETRK